MPPADSTVSLAQSGVAAGTAADRRAQLEDGLVELDCAHCGGLVRVKKNSQAHTSIQWTADAVRRCAAFTVRDGCPRLRAGIDAAVADGWLEIPEDPLAVRSPGLVLPGG